MATTATAPVLTFPMNVTKTIVITAENEGDYNYLTSTDSVDSFKADFEAFTEDFVLTVVSIT